MLYPWDKLFAVSCLLLGQPCRQICVPDRESRSVLVSKLSTNMADFAVNTLSLSEFTSSTITHLKGLYRTSIDSEFRCWTCRPLLQLPILRLIYKITQSGQSLMFWPLWMVLSTRFLRLLPALLMPRILVWRNFRRTKIQKILLRGQNLVHRNRCGRPWPPILSLTFLFYYACLYIQTQECLPCQASFVPIGSELMSCSFYIKLERTQRSAINVSVDWIVAGSRLHDICCVYTLHQGVFWMSNRKDPVLITEQVSAICPLDTFSSKLIYCKFCTSLSLWLLHSDKIGDIRSIVENKRLMKDPLYSESLASQKFSRSSKWEKNGQYQAAVVTLRILLPYTKTL